MIIRAVLLVALVLASMGQSRDGIVKPTFLKTHRIYSARDYMLLQVRIVPNAAIRTVILEAWELEDAPDEVQENGIVSEWMMPTSADRVALRRSSVIPVEPDR